jgi:hypothetical protein
MEVRFTPKKAEYLWAILKTEKSTGTECIAAFPSEYGVLPMTTVYPHNAVSFGEWAAKAEADTGERHRVVLFERVSEYEPGEKIG